MANTKVVNSEMANSEMANTEVANTEVANSDGPEMSSRPNHENAYCWLLMKGDAYLPGIFTSVFSIMRTNPNADLVIMVTNDVSEHAKKQLLKVATHLFYIPYLSFDSKQMKTERQRELYTTWISSSYSKWNALRLPYKKVILIDGDTIHTENTDELFNLHAPAMPFANPFVEPLGYLPSRYHGPKGRDGYPPHGAKISPNVLNDILTLGGMVPIATPVLLEPNADDFDAYINLVESKLPYGFPECHSGFDEQSLADFIANVKKIPLTSIHQRYNYYPWKDGFLFPGDVPRIIHFFSDTKPWNVNFDKYPDITTWYKMAALACEVTNTKPENIALTEENIIAAKKAPDEFINQFITVDSVINILGKLKV